MSDKIKGLLKERSTINVIGILVIALVCVIAGICFALGVWEWGVILLLGGGLCGMALAWIRKPEEG